jgi:hypothetical protein
VTCIGLFGYVNGGEIQNLTLNNIIVQNSLMNNGYIAGGLIGYNLKGVVSNCSVFGKIYGSQSAAGTIGNMRVSTGGLVGYNVESSIVNCTAVCTVQARTENGGLVGCNYMSTIVNSSAISQVNGSMETGGFVGRNWYGAIKNSYANSTVKGGGDVGGFAGLTADGEISGCYALGYVYGYISDIGGFAGRNSYNSTIRDCYSAVNVSGTGYWTGGFVGDNSGSMNSCFWDTKISGGNIGVGWGTPNGATGKTTDEMQMRLTFINKGWDFVNETVNGTEDIWFIREGKEYPRFVWEDQKPIADAGEDISIHCEPNGLALVQLDGSGSSDADNDPLDYHWSWTIGEQSYTAEGATPIIQLPLGSHEITLIVNDGIVDSEPNTVNVTVYNTTPVANAGADVKAYLGFEGDSVDVVLDGSESSDDDGDVLTYQWYLDDILLVEGVNPTVSLPVGEHAITLIVNDGLEDSQADEVVVIVVGPVCARVIVLPCVLNLKSHEEYIWIMMDLPCGISLSGLDKTYGYFVLPGQIRPTWVGYTGGWDPKVMARVEKEALQPYLHTGNIKLTFYGRLKDGRYIGGSDRVQVINPPDNKHGKK